MSDPIERASFPFRVLLFISMPLLISCSGEHDGGSSSAGLEEVSLRAIADSIDGRWVSERDEGMRLALGEQLRGTRGAYSVDGDEVGMRRSFLTPIKLERIEGRPAIRSLRYGRDMSFVLSVGPYHMILGEERDTVKYERHRDPEF